MFPVVLSAPRVNTLVLVLIVRLVRIKRKKRSEQPHKNRTTENNNNHQSQHTDTHTQHITNKHKQRSTHKHHHSSSPSIEKTREPATARARRIRVLPPRLVANMCSLCLSLCISLFCVGPLGPLPVAPCPFSPSSRVFRCLFPVFCRPALLTLRTCQRSVLMSLRVGQLGLALALAPEAASPPCHVVAAPESRLAVGNECVSPNRMTDQDQAPAPDQRKSRRRKNNKTTQKVRPNKPVTAKNNKTVIPLTMSDHMIAPRRPRLPLRGLLCSLLLFLFLFLFLLRFYPVPVVVPVPVV